MFKQIIALIETLEDYNKAPDGFGDVKFWLKSIKDRVQLQPKWSEEDERICQCLIQYQEEALDKIRNDKYGHSEIISDLKEMYRERIDWLKSLKDKVGREVNCTTTKELW